MVWLIIGAIVVFMIIFLIAYLSAANTYYKTVEIDCPSCGKKTNFKHDDHVFCKCKWCKTLILINEDGTYRAHTPKVDAS